MMSSTSRAGLSPFATPFDPNFRPGTPAPAGYGAPDRGIAPGQVPFTAPLDLNFTPPAQPPLPAANAAALMRPTGALIVGAPDGSLSVARAQSPVTEPTGPVTLRPMRSLPTWMPVSADAEREALADAHVALHALPPEGPATVQQVRSATRAYLTFVRCCSDRTSVSLALSNLVGLSLRHRDEVLQTMPPEAVKHVLDQVRCAGLTLDFQLASTCQALQSLLPEPLTDLVGFDAHIMIIVQGLTLVQSISTPATAEEGYATQRFRTQISEYPAIAATLVEALQTLHYHPLISKPVASFFCALQAPSYRALIQARAVPCIAVLIQSLIEQGGADAHVTDLFGLLALLATNRQSARDSCKDIDRVNLAPLIVHHAATSLKPLVLLQHLISTAYRTHVKWREEMAKPLYREPLLSAIFFMMQSRVLAQDASLNDISREHCLLLVNILADLASHGPLREDVELAWMNEGTSVCTMFENDVGIQDAVKNLVTILAREHVSAVGSPDSAADPPSASSTN